jgi:hypothetical protein
MEKKNLIYGGITLAVLGVGIYLYLNRKKSETTETSGTDKEEKPLIKKPEINISDKIKEQLQKEPKTPVSLSPTATSTTATTPKEAPKNCGKKPSIFQAKKLKEWKQCMASGGVSSFDGELDDIFANFSDFDLQF